MYKKKKHKKFTQEKNTQEKITQTHKHKITQTQNYTRKINNHMGGYNNCVLPPFYHKQPCISFSQA